MWSSYQRRYSASRAGSDGSEYTIMIALGISPPSRGELEVQRVDALGDVRRRVVEAPGVRWPVVRFGDADVVHAVEDVAERDLRFGPHERRAGTGVRAPAEGHVLTRVLPLRAELGWALEVPRV